MTYSRLNCKLQIGITLLDLELRSFELSFYLVIVSTLYQLSFKTYCLRIFYVTASTNVFLWYYSIVDR